MFGLHKNDNEPTSVKKLEHMSHLDVALQVGRDPFKNNGWPTHGFHTNDLKHSGGLGFSRGCSILPRFNTCYFCPRGNGVIDSTPACYEELGKNWTQT